MNLPNELGAKGSGGIPGPNAFQIGRPRVAVPPPPFGKPVGARSKRTRHLDQVGGVGAGDLMRGAFMALRAVPNLVALTS